VLEEFIERDGQPLCVADFNSLYGNRCGGCGEIIQGQYIQAMNRFPTYASLFEFIKHSFIIVIFVIVFFFIIVFFLIIGRYWHAGHFRCCACNSNIQGGFIERDDKPLCGSCFKAGK
jgi:hypothetical protein